MTETGTMSAKGSIVTDCHSVVYQGNERVIFYFGWTNENRKCIIFPTRCRRSVASCVMKLKSNLLFNDLTRRFGISKGLASRMYNSWMEVLAEKLQGLVVWLPRETIRAVDQSPLLMRWRVTHQSKSLK